MEQNLILILFLQHFFVRPKKTGGTIIWQADDSLRLQNNHNHTSDKVVGGQTEMFHVKETVANQRAPSHNS